MPHTRFLDKLTNSLADGTFVRLILSGKEKTFGRLIELKGAPYLSLTFRHATNDITQNLPLHEAIAWVKQQLASGVRSALLCTTKRDWQLTPQGLVGHKPTTTIAPPRTHDLPKQTRLDDSARDWLNGLGLLRPSMADKRRQIHRYLEILSHLAADCGWGDRADPTFFHNNNKTSGRHPALTLADMGCGKGYLTFGAWHLFHRVRHWPVRIIGVETRPELVAMTNNLARQIGAEGLEFVAGDIRSVVLPPLDALIALHACDTATDDAIRRGIELGAKLIVLAPCCHKQLRPQLSPPEPLAAVLKHGIMAERMAEWVTDGLRALHLETAGYRTKLFEFVASEHTPKNLMIAAIRTEKPGSQETLERFRQFFGIQHHALD